MLMLSDIIIVELRFEQSVYTVSEGDTLLLSVFLSSDQGSQLITTEAIQGTATGTPPTRNSV